MLSNFLLRCSAEVIRSDGVIAYPTESVYDLGCDPQSAVAVNRILHLKQRPVEKGLILVAASIEQLSGYIDVNETERNLITEYPSPMTWLVSISTKTPAWISGKHAKVAIRLSSHPVVIALCNQLGHPLVSTSANPSGARPANNLLQARQYFHDQVDFYIGGDTGELNRPTPITDLETGQQIRI